ncbi:MAG: 16S rRNA (guanine(527)-N(7))-methyltransferase RsmG [Ruminococcaceae bacterium]|nr:16S rRNA (guanine(527)-N(7))-methyltransferase RsmG [Oscillospiraceae bacterium]
MDFRVKYFEIMEKNFPDKRYSTDTLSEKFEILYNELVSFNEKVNLTAVTDVEGAISKHFADSLLIEEYIPKNAKIIDVGCGGGFPTLPLAIVRPDLEITALDSTEKKLKFVSLMAEKLDLKVTTLSARAEEVGRKEEYRESFDCSVARAVARLNVLSELCIPLVRVGGLFISCKAAIGEEEYNEAKKGTEILGTSTKAVYNPILYTSSEEQKRSIYIFKKASATPDKYPRQYAKITKKPL